MNDWWDPATVAEALVSIYNVPPSWSSAPALSGTPAYPGDLVTLTEVTANRFGQSYAAAPKTITVHNVAPAWTAAPILSGNPFYPGDMVGLSASVTDPGLSDTLAYSINWGDGTQNSTGAPSAGTISLAARSHHVLAAFSPDGKTIAVSSQLEDE